MEDVSTNGSYTIQDCDEKYKKIHFSINKKIHNFEKQGLKLLHLNSHQSLNDFYSYWKVNLPTYQSRREYIRSLYNPMEQKINEILIEIDDDDYGTINLKELEIDDDKGKFELKKDELEIDEKLCFVLMPFDEKFNSIYNTIKEIVEDDEFALNCKRADEIFTIGVIIEDIWDYIQKARILVAELTEKNPNVFYELGLAHAMNKEVILITQNVDDIPFDLRHHRYIVYENSIDGAEKLKEVLKNTLRGQLKE
jgi:hypothetical protein